MKSIKLLILLLFAAQQLQSSTALQTGSSSSSSSSSSSTPFIYGCFTTLACALPLLWMKFEADRKGREGMNIAMIYELNYLA